MRVTDTHIYFWGSFLSNFIPKDLNIYYMGFNFNTSEQLFMYIKAKFFNDHDKAHEIATKGQEPRDAKRMGREIQGYDDETWSKYREEAMYKAVRLKFLSDSKLMNQLLDTGDKILVEGTPMDPIWGVMIKWDDDRILDEKNWKGQNLLGKVLMRVRNDLK
jgi:ribA/ribD-fused uncharacterized protein